MKNEIRNMDNDTKNSDWIKSSSSNLSLIA